MEVLRYNDRSVLCLEETKHRLATYSVEACWYAARVVSLKGDTDPIIAILLDSIWTCTPLTLY